MEPFAPSFERLTQSARTCGLITDGTLGIAVTGLLEPARLRAILDCIVQSHPDSTYELLCHPGYNDSHLDAQQTRLRASREVEYQTLLEVIPEYSRNPERLHLIHYGNLGVPGLQRASGQYARNTGFEKVL
jgi:predicted glycoside hydrolase/deacetylase ChbG (UPF0249 family)